MASDQQRMLHELAELRRIVHGMVRYGSIKEVNGDKVRVDLGDGALSPWIHTNNFRGQARERIPWNPPKDSGGQQGGGDTGGSSGGSSGGGSSAGGAGSDQKKDEGGGQNVMLIMPSGDPSQAVILPYGPNKNNKAPAHANKSGKDEHVYQLEDLRISHGKDGYDIWLEEEQQQQDAGGAGGGDSGGEQGGSQERNTGGDKARVKMRLHNDGGVTCRVGSGDDAKRFHVHKDGVKMKVGKDHWAVIAKEAPHLRVSENWVVQEDPIKDDDK